MRAGGLFCRPKRRVQATTDSAHRERRFEQLLPTVVPTQPNHVWHVDPTYVRVKHGFGYLACVLDSFTREIVGWARSRCIDAALAVKARGNAPHADQGSGYARHVSVDRLREAGLIPSLSRKGNPYDNARMQNLDQTLNTEHVDLQDDLDFDDAPHHINHFIGQLYNQDRLHASLGYLPPAEFATHDQCA